MPEDIYELISLGARYWFSLLGVLIVWRSFSWLRKDRRAKHKRLKRLPDAGMIGEMVVLRGSDELPEGCAIPVPREGTLGFLRTCDVVVPVEGVAPRHIDLAFQPGRGLLLFPWRGCACTVDGEELTARSKTKNHPMHHGSRLEVGDALLRLRLFAGLETERRNAFLPDEPAAAQPDSAAPDISPMNWQDSPYVYHQIPAEWDATGRYAPVAPDPWQNQQPYDQDDQQPGQAYPPYETQDDRPQQGYQQPWAGPDWRSKGWQNPPPAQPWQQPMTPPADDWTEPDWQEQPSWQESSPWDESAPQGDAPIWQSPTSPEDAGDDFAPIHARQRRSRFGRRRSE